MTAQDTSTTEAAAERTDSPQAAAPAGLQLRVEDAYREYAQALHDVWTAQDVQQQYLQAYHRYAGALQEAAMPAAAQSRTEEAYRTYVRQLQDAGTSSDAQQRAAQAYEEYVQALQDAAPADVERRYGDAYLTYLRELQQALAPGDVERQVNRARRAYLRALQNAWAEADADSLDGEALSAVSSSIAAGAQLALAAQATVRERWQAAGYLAATAVQTTPASPSRTASGG